MGWKASSSRLPDFFFFKGQFRKGKTSLTGSPSAQEKREDQELVLLHGHRAHESG